MDDNNPLLDLYIQISSDEGPISIEDFLKRVLSNEFGPYPMESILQFIDLMEQNVMTSIQLHSIGLPEHEVQKIIDSEKERFENLRRSLS